MNDLFDEVKDKLQKFIDNTDLENKRDVKRTKNYLSALLSHIDAVNREKSFILTDEQRSMINRGSVVWVDFGFNIGKEFGGRHPAIILHAPKNRDIVTVVPIDSEPDDERKLAKRLSKDYWVEIPCIYNMKKGRNWTNVYRVVNISVIRIDLTKLSNAYIDKDILLKIDEQIANFQYKPCAKSQKYSKVLDKSSKMEYNNTQDKT